MVSCHVELTCPPLESTLSPIVSSCSLPPPLEQFSFGAANIEANQVSPRQPPGADHPGWIRLPPMPMGVLAVILCCWETPLHWWWAVVPHPTIPKLHFNIWPLLLWGATRLRDTRSPPSLNQLCPQANTLLALFMLLQQEGPRIKGGRGPVQCMTSIGTRCLMMTNMTMRKIIFQSPMLCIQHQPWTLRERHSLLPRWQNWPRSIAKSSWRVPFCCKFLATIFPLLLHLRWLKCAGPNQTLTTLSIMLGHTALTCT